MTKEFLTDFMNVVSGLSKTDGKKLMKVMLENNDFNISMNKYYGQDDSFRNMADKSIKHIIGKGPFIKEYIEDSKTGDILIIYENNYYRVQKSGKTGPHKSRFNKGFLIKNYGDENWKEYKGKSN